MITFTFESYFIFELYLTQLSFHLGDHTNNDVHLKCEIKMGKFLKNLCRMHLSPRVATSASIPAHQLLISRDTCGNIREKNLSSVINVTTLAHKLATSRHTCWLIQVRSLSVVCNVNILAHKLLTSRHTWGFTLVRIPLVAHNVTTLANKLVISGDTRWHTLEKSFFFVLARSQVNLLRYLTLESYIPTSTLSTK